MVLAAIVLLLALVGASLAFAEGDWPPSSPHPDYSTFLESDSSHVLGPAPNSEAAEELPHEELGREEALKLMQSVFGYALQGAPEAASELEVERYYSNHVALLEGEGAEQPALLESALPLRAENESGEQAPVDLELEHSEGEIQPANPLVEVGIPVHLHEGISLPETGVSIKLDDAPSETAPTTVDSNAAFFPNVATDSDLTVTPVSTGVETLTQLRSPDAPSSESFELTLPSGATLQETSDGGAEVIAGGETLVSVLPPSATDAEGHQVPATLETSGNSVVIQAHPGEDAAYPILVDPIYQSYYWAAKPTSAGLDDWVTASDSSLYQNRNIGGWGQFGINIYSYAGTPSVSNPMAWWTYYVPRFFTDYENPNIKERPTTFIKGLSFSNVYWWIEESTPYKYYPYVGMGLWAENQQNWLETAWRFGTSGQLTDPNWVYAFKNPNEVSDVKQGTALMASNEAVSYPRHFWIGQATVELSDKDSPGFTLLNGPGQWVNNEATTPIQYSVEDFGLGIRELRIAQPSTGGTERQINTSLNCTGGVSSPCPHTVSTSATNLSYDPSSMPQGEDWVKAYALDPLGHEALVQGKHLEARIKVDHTSPTLALSGTLTEQGKVGPKLGSYSLGLSATDGMEAAPQSGVSKTIIKVDGSVVDESSPGCATKNCSISREWTLDVSKYATGAHSVKVTATDGVGLSTTKELSIYLQPSPSPTISLSGTMTEQESLGTTRPRYKLMVNANAEAGQFGPSTYSTAFGSYGSGNGQLSHPAGVAVDSKGFLWVADRENSRIEKFKEDGGYVLKFGTAGSEAGKLKQPSDLAIDSKGNFWIADTGNNRVDEFNEKREFVMYTNGNIGTGTPFKEPEGIAVDTKGNIWVADTHGARLVELNSSGDVVKVLASKELSEPAGIDIGPSGEIWVADRGGNKILEFSEAGQLVRQIGSEGSAPLQFKHPGAIDVDIEGNLWVGDEGNDRVQEFDEHGEYLGQFGSEGSGNGQFSFGYPIGLAVDGKGNVLVADTGNNRIQKWQVPSYVPTTLGSFGSSGAEAGQFSHPAGMAVGPNGNLWVVDQENNRVEEFNQAGEYLGALQTSASQAAELYSPRDVAVDASGHVWIADPLHNKIKEYDEESGKYLSWFSTSCRQDLGEQISNCLGGEGLAVDKEGNLWVADTYHARIEEFNQAGERLKVFGTKGTAEGQLYEPTGIAIGPGGNVWVAEWHNHHVMEFTPNGELVMQFGTSGTVNGKFKHPDALEVDERGNVWVTDEENNRVQEFNHNGEYVAQFGAAGSGPGQFSFKFATGIATDSKGNLWVADPNNNRVQRWNYANTDSEIKTEVLIDGKQTETGKASCIGTTCPVTTNWILESPGYETGEHVVKVKATDGLGRSTTKILSIGIQRDTTKPVLEVSGGLAQAPSGWVEQHKYTLSAEASDSSGFGAVSLVFQMDNHTVKSKTDVCPDGGCKESFSETLDMSMYSGGMHTAEVTAVDGAGNKTTKTMTINVDPQGKVSIAEVTKTLEAVEATSTDGLIAPSPPAELIGEELKEPSLVQEGIGVHTVDGQVETTTSGSISDGFTVYPMGGPVTVEPIEVGSSASALEIASGNAAAISANTGTSADTVVRPVYDGLMSFQAIRDATSPSQYSWEVLLAPDQQLKLVNSELAEVYYEGAEEKVAIAIVATPAHDANGSVVPTSLTTNGNMVTLMVHHKEGNPALAGAPFVYPVVAGTGWEGGFQTSSIQMPPAESDEELEQNVWQSYTNFSPPEAVEPADEEAVASRAGVHKRSFSHIECSHLAEYWHVVPDSTTYEMDCGNPFTNKEGNLIAYRAGLHGTFYQEEGFYHKNYKVWHLGSSTDRIGCQTDTGWQAKGDIYRRAHVDRCVWWGSTSGGNGGQSATWGHHITPVGRFIGEERGTCADDCGRPNPWNSFKMPPMAFYLWANGHYAFHETDCIDC